MTIHGWLLFCATETALCLSPGPSTLMVVSLAITRDQAAGFLGSVGVLGANAIYFGATASGLAAVYWVSADAFTVIKWAGAAYLIVLGLRMVLRSVRGQPPAPPAPSRALRRNALWKGFVTQGANPNLLVYFTAILPQFVDPSRSLGGQVAILACSSFVIELAVLSAYATLASRAGRLAAPRSKRLTEGVGGSLLIAAGAGLASLKQG